MSDTVLARYAKPVPRYTSYPTAPHFHDGVDDLTYASWLGSPSMLKPHDLIELASRVRQCFDVSCKLEFSIEIDPNDMTCDRYDAFAEAGVTRISVGVQDFNAKDAINRIQTFEQTKAVVDGMRQRGVTSVNLDVLYGLPHQTVGSVLSTVDQALSMSPDRLALFGYAHVPWMKTHQRLIDETALPDPAERLRQSLAAAKRICAAGYVAVGIDHFAKPTDTLAMATVSGRLHRNFRGYTTDEAPALIGFGASSIGCLPQGHVQNITATGEYIRAIRERGLAVAKGLRLSEEDRMRGWVIERLMCDFAVSVDELRYRFKRIAAPVITEMVYAAQGDQDGVVWFDGHTFSITERGRPFVRSVAATFDSYLASGVGRRSVAV